MKKRQMLVPLLTLACIAAYGQDGQPETKTDSVRTEIPEKPKQEVYQTFKGIAIAGSDQDFRRALAAKGFSACANASYMTGTFSGFPVYVFTETTVESKLVYRVSAYLEITKHWGEVKDQYKLFKKNITEKYGQPYANVWEFVQPYREGDGFEYKALASKKARCYCIWKTEYGEIIISIEQNSEGLCLRVAYTDLKMYLKNEAEKKKRFQEDL